MFKLLSREDLRKGLAYLAPWDGYWQESPPTTADLAQSTKLGAYPLDFRPRIRQGHYPAFDDEGVPMWPHPADGQPRYFTTAMTSFALGSWHDYLVSGREEALDRTLKVADRLTRGSWEGSELHLLDEDREPLLSAMSQGEAMSVLCRVFQETGKARYAEAAVACLGPFMRTVDDDGVQAFIAGTKSLWFEELTSKPVHHILNGMVYAIWGLQDLARATGERRADQLATVGVSSIAREIDRFDMGWWSRYWFPEKGGVHYAASAMYHGLHICQLRALGGSSGRSELTSAADRFQAYMTRPMNRLRAALAYAKGRLALRRVRATRDG
jgi:heparosan-N-sulfate-glucuronate 5-epimerase